MKRYLVALAVGLGLLTLSSSSWAQALTCSVQSVSGTYTFILAGSINDETISVLGVVTAATSGAISGTSVTSNLGAPGVRQNFTGTWVLESPGTANCFLTINTSTGLGLTGRVVATNTILISVVFDPSRQLAGIAWRQQ